MTKEEAELWTIIYTECIGSKPGTHQWLNAKAIANEAVEDFRKANKELCTPV